MTFEIKGTFKLGRKQQKFTKQINEEKQERAVDKLVSTFGGLYRLKRKQIKIVEINKVSGKQTKPEKSPGKTTQEKPETKTTEKQEQKTVEKPKETKTPETKDKKETKTGTKTIEKEEKQEQTKQTTPKGGKQSA